MAITITSDAEWNNFRHAVGGGWADDTKLETTVGRLQSRDELDQAITTWTSTQDHHVVMHNLQSAGVACGAVYNTREITTDAHLRDRGFFPISEHPAPVGRRPHWGPLFNFMGVNRGPDRLALTFGEHKRYLLGDLLGVSDAELESLRADKVIGEVPATSRMAPPPDADDLLRMGFLAEHDLYYKKHLGLEDDPNTEKVAR